MSQGDFAEMVRSIVKRDPRYDPEAYAFVREALDFSVKLLKKPADAQRRHLTGQELLEGIRLYAVQEFGPMSMTVLREWGLHSTSDFGEIVFNMVECGLLGKTDEDRKEDFAHGYSFENAFVRPFLPQQRRRTTSATPHTEHRNPPANRARNHVHNKDQQKGS